MVDEVDAGRVCQPHLPTTGQWSQLRHWLLLNLAVGIVLAAIHANVLLAARVHPGRCPSIMINKVRTALRRPSLLPTWWQLAGSWACCARVHHGSVAVAATGSGATRGAAAWGRS